MTGPKELISASVGIRTPSKPTLPRRYSAAEANSIARSNSRMMVFVTAAFRPAVRFMRASSAESASVRAFICCRRSLPRPYWSVSESPRRLSSTKLLSAPAPARNFIPSSPLAFETKSGTSTPTVT